MTTREEAIALMKRNADGYYPKMTEALDIAIKALEQEPILDKIRAEIDRIYEREGNTSDCLNALDDLKWFIDKCKE